MKSNIQPLELRVHKYSNVIETNKKCKNKQLLPKIVPNYSFKTRKLFFNNYIPIREPYVISIFRLLVNSLEIKVSELNLMNIMRISNIRKMKIKDNARILFELDENHALQRLNFDLIYSFNIPEQIYLLQSALKLFHPALIHFSNQDLVPIINNSLYDCTMRPNSSFQSIVKHTMLRSSRTIIDTAAFLMIHFFHIWEYSVSSIEIKKKIIRYYGNLMVSFECRPKLIDVNNISPEACFFGIILESTDIEFWNNLSNHRILEAFNFLNEKDKLIRHKSKKSVIFPQILNLLNYNCPISRIPIFSFFDENQLITNDESVEIDSADIPTCSSYVVYD